MAEDEGPETGASMPEPRAQAAPEMKAQPEIPKELQPLEAEVQLPGEPPAKVTLTPVAVTPDGKEATVKVTMPEEAEKQEGHPEAPNLAPLLLVAAAAVLVLAASSKGRTNPSAAMFQ
jgi:hypothetical protein